jgi:hypothetical protein
MSKLGSALARVNYMVHTQVAGRRCFRLIWAWPWLPIRQQTPQDLDEVTCYIVIYHIHIYTHTHTHIHIHTHCPGTDRPGRNPTAWTKSATSSGAGAPPARFLRLTDLLLLILRPVSPGNAAGLLSLAGRGRLRADSGFWTWLSGPTIARASKQLTGIYTPVVVGMVLGSWHGMATT